MNHLRWPRKYWWWPLTAATAALAAVITYDGLTGGQWAGDIIVVIFGFTCGLIGRWTTRHDK